MLAVLALTGCTGTDAAPQPAPAASTATAVPASVDHPLGEGTIDAAPATVLQALFEQVAAAGGVRATLTGGSVPTTLEVDADATARRYTWQQAGARHEQVELPGGRVCLNRPAARALAGSGNNVVGVIRGGGRPYSCSTTHDSLGGMLGYGFRTYDPLGRIAANADSVELTDLGLDTVDAVDTRHLALRISALEPPYTYDLWVDDALRVVRAEYGAMTATLTYGDVAPVRLPAAAERDDLVLTPGTGHAGGSLSFSG